MALLERQGDGAAMIADRFQRVDDEEGLPPSGGVLVSLARLRADGESLLERDGELGVWLASDESPKALIEVLEGTKGAKLDSLSLVALDFPVFSDGRGFSSARILRERFGFKGELRAIGDVLIEQIPFMLRSGFDTFEMASEKALEDFRAVVDEVRVVYQPTGDGRATAWDIRLGRSD